MHQIQVPTVGDELRELERRVDVLLDGSFAAEVPQTARIVLRSASSLLMAARHLWEDAGLLP